MTRLSVQSEKSVVCPWQIIPLFPQFELFQTLVSAKFWRPNKKNKKQINRKKEKKCWNTVKSLLSSIPTVSFYNLKELVPASVSYLAMTVRKSKEMQIIKLRQVPIMPMGCPMKIVCLFPHSFLFQCEIFHDAPQSPQLKVSGQNSFLWYSGFFLFVCCCFLMRWNGKKGFQIETGSKHCYLRR